MVMGLRCERKRSVETLEYDLHKRYLCKVLAEVVFAQGQDFCFISVNVGTGQRGLIHYMLCEIA